MHPSQGRRTRDAISFAVGIVAALGLVAVFAVWFRSLDGPPDGTWRSDSGASVTLLERHATFTDLPLSPWSAIGTGGCDTEGAAITLTRVGD